jgi:hypothetical protein
VALVRFQFLGWQFSKSRFLRWQINNFPNKLLDRREERECSENYFLYNSTVCIKCFLSLISLYTTPLFIVFDVINAHAIIYNQFNLSYLNYTVTLIV